MSLLLNRAVDLKAYIVDTHVKLEERLKTQINRVEKLFQYLTYVFRTRIISNKA